MKKSITTLDLNLLLCLQLLMQERSVTKAAKRMNVTPSAVSKSLAKLRAWFDDPLFVNSPLGLSPTPLMVSMEQNLAEWMQMSNLLLDKPHHQTPRGLKFELAAESPLMMIMLYGIGELPEIVTLPKGKPVFSDKNLPSFSISYAGNMVGVALTTEGECGLDMELQRATRGFHSPHAPDNHTFSSNESLWISKQNDPNEARAQLITLRRSVLKLTGDVLNDDPRDLQLLPIAGRLKCAHVNHVEALCDAEDVLVWSVAVTPTIEKLSVWELDGKHGWKSLPDIHSRANNPTSRMMRFAQLSTVKAFSPN